MSDNITFSPFDKQVEILQCDKRIIGAFAGKRGGKTEIGAIKSIIFQENKKNSNPNSIDPFTGAIIAPTTDMLRRLSLQKFMLYAKPFIKNFNKTTSDIIWHDDSIIYGLSADRPHRIEGLKLNWVWCDEIFQMNEQLFLEVKARTSDTQGNIICTGSLGVNFINPKSHWAYRYFKKNPDQNTACFEWATTDNPYFPQEELVSLKENLDPETYRQMFMLSWDTSSKNAVYSDFNEHNIVSNYVYQPNLPVYVSIDWGWAHPMACLFFQYDEERDTIWLFDEIVGSQITIEQLYSRMKSKPYRYSKFCCDIAGSQEREQTGKSNIAWFKEKNVHFERRSTAIQYGIPIVRSYILNGRGQRKFYVNASCKRSIDGLKRYRYAEKDGVIQNENPLKVDDDCVDAIRYFFVNFMDKSKKEAKTTIARWL